MSTDNFEDNYPIAVLIEELRNEDIQFRLNSIKKLSTIALALGPEKTRTQLVPFLTESIYDEDDVLMALAEQLFNLINYVGGTQYISVLLKPLEHLSTVEENVVREKAIEVLQKIALYHKQSDMENSFYTMVFRLASGTWFANKCSAASLLAVTYPRVNKDIRAKIFYIIDSLSKDEMPLVKKDLVGQLGQIAKVMLGKTEVISARKMIENSKEKILCEDIDCGEYDLPSFDYAVEKNRVMEIIIPYLTTFFEDEQDVIRLNVVESAIDVAEALNFEETGAVPGLVKIIQGATSDKSWRVRYVVGNKFPVIYKAFGAKLINEELLDCFMSLLGDSEAEVRVISINRVKALAYCLAGKACPSDDGLENSENVNKSNKENGDVGDSGFMETDMKNEMNGDGINQFNQLTNSDSISSADTDSLIFTCRTSELLKCLQDFKQKLSKKQKTSIISETAKDDKMDTDFSLATDPIILKHILPNLKELCGDTNRHVRAMLASTIMGLVPLLGKEMTEEHLLPIILEQLNDSCPEVRLNLIMHFGYLNSVIGVEKFVSNIMPVISQLAIDKKWRVRLGIMNYLLLLAENSGEKFFSSEMLLLCFDWLIDPFYAIRLEAVLNIAKLAAVFGTSWGREKLVTNVLRLSTEENYLHRMICVECIICLSEVVDEASCIDDLLPAALRLSEDSVPNVRFKAAQSLSHIGSNISKEKVESLVLPKLRNLMYSDSDRDVVFYARESMNALVPLPVNGKQTPFQSST